MFNLKFYILFTIILFTASANANSNAPLPMFPCDTCNVQRMQQIAELQAPLLQCDNTVNPETGITDIEYWENNATCYAPTKDLLVVNPITKVAFKYRVKGYNPMAGEAGYVMSLPMSADETEIVQTYYDIYNAINDAVSALNSSSYAGSNSSESPPSTLLADEIAQANANSPGVSESCLNSAAAHLFSKDINKNRLLDEMRAALESEIGNRTWRNFTSSLQLTGAEAAAELTITAGPLANVAGATSVAVQQQYLESSFLMTPVGARSCSFFGLWCQEADLNNQIHYRVSYLGDVTTSGINKMYLNFELLTSLSRVDGNSASSILNAQQMSLTGSPNSCLAQLVNEVSAGDLRFVSEGPIGQPTSYDFGNGPMNFCEQSRTVRACTNTGSGTTKVCYDVQFTSLTMCGSGL